MSPEPDKKGAADTKQSAWAGRLYDWLDTRYQLGNFVSFLSHKDVPITRMSFFYYFGGIALFLFIIQVCTGILLLMYYVPSADHAYESVQYIMA